MGCFSIGMGDRFNALLVSLMALWLMLDRNRFWLFYLYFSLSQSQWIYFLFAHDTLFFGWQAYRLVPLGMIEFIPGVPKSFSCNFSSHHAVLQEKLSLN